MHLLGWTPSERAQQCNLLHRGPPILRGPRPNSSIHRKDVNSLQTHNQNIQSFELSGQRLESLNKHSPIFCFSRQRVCFGESLKLLQRVAYHKCFRVKLLVELLRLSQAIQLIAQFANLAKHLLNLAPRKHPLQQRTGSELIQTSRNPKTFN